jgi:hypothetical protein
MRVIEQREIVSPFGYVRAWLSDDESNRYAMGTWFKSAVLKVQRKESPRLMVVIDQRCGVALPRRMNRPTLDMHRRAQLLGYDGLLLLALASDRHLDYETMTSPDPLRNAAAQTSPMNLRAIVAGATGKHIMQTEVPGVQSDVVCAWGGRRGYNRALTLPTVNALLKAGTPLFAFGMNRNGDPCRYLNVPFGMPIIPWSPKTAGYVTEDF